MGDNDKAIVVYERGKELIKKGIPPEQQEILQLVLLDDMAVSLREIEASHKKEEFEGKKDSRTLSASDVVQWINLIKDWPHTPWTTATFFNDGPNRVYIAINDPYDWSPLNNGDTLPADFTKADRRMEIIGYRCGTGETASVRAVGKY